MIFPIGDTNVQGGYKPVFSYAFIGINILIFLLQFSTPGNLICPFATIPDDIVHGHKLHTLLTSMFMHGGWMHLIGNMMFLWVFADNIEAVLGNARFVVLYILGGLFASGLHIFFEILFADPSMINCCKPCLSELNCATTGGSAIKMCSTFVPSLGASGAISAVLGAYIVMFPKSRIRVLFFITTFTVPALMFLGFWFVEQMISGVGSLSKIGAAASGGGVAWWAHIGGFVFGLVYGWLHRGYVEDFVQQRV